jgi:isoquinoline 1-oxidoreductase beta subunit
VPESGSEVRPQEMPARDPVALTRRGFLQSATAAGGGLLLAFGVDPAVTAVLAATSPLPSLAAPREPAPRFSVFLAIASDGTVHVTGPQSEMGQGTYDGLAKILAEELGADWARVEIHLPSGDDAFRHPVTRRHRTAGSDSISSHGEVMRRAGATAREMLIAAGAAAWGVAAADCDVAESAVIHGPTGRRAGFGTLAEAAASLPVPAAPRYKDRSQYTLVGRRTHRKDAPPKVTGRAVFGIDVRQPGMLHAALCRSPTVAGRVTGFSREAAVSLPGVVDAYAISDGIAVLARTTWHAWQAARALAAHPGTRYDDSASEAIDTTGMRQRLAGALQEDARAQVARAPAGRTHDRAVMEAAFATAARREEWTYEVPFLAHAAMEPLNATALVTADAVTVWAPTQHPDGTRDMIAKVTGLPRESCRLEVTFLGGGFGRKWETDFVRQAVEIARGRPGTPVQLNWTREQDFRHDRFRPAHRARSRAALDAQGRLVGLHTRISGISMWRYQQRPAVPGLGDPFMTGGLIGERYAIPAPYADFVETPEPVPVGTWRSVAQSMNGFFAESTIDDIAAASGRDPLGLRMELAATDARAIAVLRRAAELIGWASSEGTEERAGSGRKRTARGRSERGRGGLGIALTVGFGSWCAQAVEVRASGRRISIMRIVAVVDCGQVIDPGSVEAQVSGGVLFGLSAAIDGQIRFQDGAAQDVNFDTAPMLRFSAAPPITVELVRSEAASGGVGEISTPGIAPALAGAIFSATGMRARRLPLIEEGFSFA